MAGLGVEAGTLSVAVGARLAEGFGSALAGLIDKEVGPAADKAGKTLGDRIAGGIEKAGRNITKGLTVPLLALGGTVLAAGQTLDGALDSIQVGTGKTGEALAGLQQSFKDVAGASSASFDTVSSTLVDLTTRLGLTGQPLEDLTTQIVNLGEITGKSINVDDVSKLFAAFQVPADEYSKTLDRVFQVSQATGVEFSTLVSKAGSQAAQFQSFGFSVEQAVTTLGQLEKAGIDSSQVLNGLRRTVAKGLKGNKDAEKATESLAKAEGKRAELLRDIELAELKLQEVQADPKAKESTVLGAQNALKKYQEELAAAEGEISSFNSVIANAAQSSGVSTQKVFADTVGQIKQLIDAGKEQEAQALALEVAGPRAYLNLVRAIKEGAISAEGFASVIDPDALGINASFAATADFTEQVKIFKNQLNVKLGEVGMTVFPVITDVLNQLLPVLGELLTEGGKVAKDLLPTFSAAIKIVLPIIQDLVGFFVDLPGPIKNVVAQGLIFTAILGPILTKVSGLIGAFKGLVGAIGGIQKVFGLLAANPSILAFIAVVAVIAGAAYLIYKNWDGIVAFFRRIGAGIQAAFSGLVRAVQAIWTGLVNVVKGVFEGVKNLIVTYVTVVYVKPFQLFLSAVQGVWNKIRGVVETVLRAITTAVSSVVSVITGIWNGLTSVFTRVWDGLRGAVRGAVDFVLGLIRGLRDTIIGLLDPRQLFGGLANAGKSLLGNIPGIGGLFRAAGGPVQAGQPYIVGELGPELYVPRTSGTILPNSMLAGALGGGGVQYNITVVNPQAEPTSTSIPNALRKANYLRS